MYVTTIPLGVRTVSEIMMVIKKIMIQNECNKIINQFGIVLLSTTQVNSNKILVVQQIQTSHIHLWFSIQLYTE